MADVMHLTSEIQLRLDRLRARDESARDELLKLACGRLRRLAHKMLRGYPNVKRWEQTDDVLQNASLRLCRALAEVQPASVRSFINLAAVAIRRELIDLARHYHGAEGMGRHHISWDALDGLALPPGAPDAPDDSDDPARLALWTEFHAHVDALPDIEKEIFDLIWYQGLKQSEVAELLGITEGVVKYRWRSARVKLYEILGGQLPW
jgi:RNA polymerase sigma-70 factor (ECF subfamily)